MITITINSDPATFTWYTSGDANADGSKRYYCHNNNNVDTAFLVLSYSTSSKEQCPIIFNS